MVSRPPRLSSQVASSAWDNSGSAPGSWRARRATGRAAGQVPQHQFDHPVRQVELRRPGRPFDGRPDLLAPVIGPTTTWPSCSDRGQLRASAQRPAVEVGPQSQHDDGGAGQRAERADEGLPLCPRRGSR